MNNLDGTEAIEKENDRAPCLTKRDKAVSQRLETVAGHFDVHVGLGERFLCERCEYMMLYFYNQSPEGHCLRPIPQKFSSAPSHRSRRKHDH